MRRESELWEIFDPRYGPAIFSTRFEFLAKILTRLLQKLTASGVGLDYAQAGKGWD